MMETNSEGVMDRCSPEIRQLATLVKSAIGSSSLKEFSIKSGISEGTLSRLRNGTIANIPKEKTLEQIAAASPENGITLNDLLIAAGYEARKGEPSGMPLAQNGHSIPEEIISHGSKQIPGPTILIAITLVMNYFFSSIEEFKMNLSCHTSFFCIQSENLKHGIVGIPAFLGTSNGDTAAVTRMMAAIIVTAQNVTDNDELVIVTDSDEIYNSLNTVFQNIRGCVLLTKDYLTISSRN